ncbi:MAG TPA: acyltransferase [Actinocrinis sp.]|nr:acyltransferase [Actinocrinis sp.]
MGAFVHQTAQVEPGAVLGEGTRVWHQVHVRRGAVVGAGCSLGKNVFVDEGVVLGDRVKIQNNVSVYHGVELGDDVFVGPSAVFTNDFRPRAHSADWRVGRTLVLEGASIGANATVVCGVVVGRNALVGAGSVVTRDVADHQLVYGNPARPQGWVCRCGEVVSRAQAAPAELRCPACLGERPEPAGPDSAPARPQSGPAESALR